MAAKSWPVGFCKFFDLYWK